MKKLSLTTVAAGIFILSASICQAQNFYAGIGIGYGFPSGVQAFQPSVNPASVTSESYSLGQGLSIGINGGYMLTQNVGLELGIADKFSSSISETETDNTPSSTTYTAKGSCFSFTPAIRFMLGNGNLKYYSVTGLIIGLPSSTMETDGSEIVGGVPFSLDEIDTYSGHIILGFHGAIGIMYKLSDKIGIFGEVDANMENWAPSKMKVTTYNVNAVNELGSLSPSQQETDFVSSYNPAANSNPNAPTQSVKTYLPFSSWGITVGVAFSFGGSGSSTPATK